MEALPGGGDGTASTAGATVVWSWLRTAPTPPPTKTAKDTKHAVMILQTAHKQYQVSKVVLKVGHAKSVFLRF